MKGNSEVVQHLNQQLANEQSAFNQYLLHSQLFKNWGIEKLAKTEREEAMEEVGHAEAADRAHPLPRRDAQDGRRRSGVSQHRVREALKRDLDLEVKGIATCARASPPPSAPAMRSAASSWSRS